MCEDEINNNTLYKGKYKWHIFYIHLTYISIPIRHLDQLNCHTYWRVDWPAGRPRRRCRHREMPSTDRTACTGAQYLSYKQYRCSIHELQTIEVLNILATNNTGPQFLSYKRNISALLNYIWYRCSIHEHQIIQVFNTWAINNTVVQYLGYK